MKSKMQRWGNCLAVRIPNAFAREAGLEDKSPIELRLDGGTIVVEPIGLVPTLEELLAGVTRGNAHLDLDWRPDRRPEGRHT